MSLVVVSPHPDSGSEGLHLVVADADSAGLASDIDGTFAWIHLSKMNHLRCVENDAAEIEGKRITVVRIRSLGEQDSEEIIGMDHIARANAGVQIGELVALRRHTPLAAKKVVIKLPLNLPYEIKDEVEERLRGRLSKHKTIFSAGQALRLYHWKIQELTIDCMIAQAEPSDGTAFIDSATVIEFEYDQWDSKRYTGSWEGDSLSYAKFCKDLSRCPIELESFLVASKRSPPKGSR